MSIQTFQRKATDAAAIEDALSLCPFSPNLILAFGPQSLLVEASSIAANSKFKDAHLVGCTTSGEIAGHEITDLSLSLTLIKFKHTEIRCHECRVADSSQSLSAGKEISEALTGSELKHVFVLSDGLMVNGDDLVRGLRENIPKDVAFTGGLAADGDRFKSTSVLSPSGVASGKVIGIGFYGSRLKVGFGSLGGWDPFGTERVITKSKSNVLYELDGAPILPLYKRYLGEFAAGLPASGLLFPLSISIPGSVEPLVRTLLSIDEDQQSMTFAGDVPEGCRARLMKANTSRLVDGAASAANICSLALESQMAELAILISCVGRRLVLKQRAEEEIESVIEQLGSQSAISGFYSYGEIAPFMKHARCEFHNQTMTITAFSEE